jgi:hypothetical protein
MITTIAADVNVTCTPIPRQLTSKHSFLTIEAMLSVWSVPRVYKRTQKTRPRESRVVESEVRGRASKRQPAGI